MMIPPSYNHPTNHHSLGLGGRLGGGRREEEEEEGGGRRTTIMMGSLWLLALII